MFSQKKTFQEITMYYECSGVGHIVVDCGNTKLSANNEVILEWQWLRNLTLPGQAL